MKKIILLLFPLLAGIASFDTAKDISITGTVTDQAGNALSASVHAGKIYAVTNSAGQYQIAVSQQERYLVFSSPGFREQKIQIGKKRVIDVKMLPSSADLKEVVLTAAGMRMSPKVPGYSNVLLQGKVSGLMVSPGRQVPRYGYHDTPYPNTEGYDPIAENGFKKVTEDPLSTFSIDVDAASYSNVRRFLNNNELPPSGAVRSEEMINYFKYHYPQPRGNDPFSINTELSDCPWNSNNKLLLIGLQGKNVPVENLPPSNLVFLIDVSGSMMSANKLPLVKASMKMLTDQLRQKDKISIVVYAGNAGLVLPATSGNDKIRIKTAIDELEAGGSTAGGAGIELAYKIARQHFMENGNNRVILCTDGDFNVGASSDDEMVTLIEKQRNTGIFLTVLGYGTGNYKDNKMQQLADKGNGNHAYIDGIGEARKVLVNEFGGTLFTIASDVKLQLEFNPARVAGYRLIGYENRILDKEDFNDDKKDAGELGSGHTVTALYEIVPAGVYSPFLRETDSLKYQTKYQQKEESNGAEMAVIRFRYKAPGEERSQLIVHTVMNPASAFGSSSDNMRFAAAVAGFAMLLRESRYKGDLNFNKIIRMADNSLSKDTEGYRKEFVELVKKAALLKRELAKNETD